MSVNIYFEVGDPGEVPKLCLESNPDIIESDEYTMNIVQMSFDDFRKKKWFIIFHPDFQSVNESSQSWFHIDEDPLEFINCKFINTQQMCDIDRGWEGVCSLTHAEDMNTEIDIEEVLCNVKIDSNGKYRGLRIINANEEYPDEIEDLPNYVESEEHYHLIYVYDTTKFKEPEIVTESRFHNETLRKIDEYNSSGGPLSIIVNLLVETYMNKYCPFCKTVFVDWSGCLQLQCSNVLCQKYFCGLCLVYGTSSQNLLEKHYDGCNEEINEILYNIHDKHTVIRFQMLKEAISRINPTIKNKIIRKLYEIARGTLIANFLLAEYRIWFFTINPESFKKV